MLKVYVNGADITNSVEFGSIQTTEQLNNRRNTARFRVIDTTIEEAQLVKIFKGSSISPVSAGASSVTIDDTFETSGFYFPGKEIRVGYGTASEEVKTVLSIDYATKVLTFTSALRSSHSSGDLVGEEIFAGVTLKNPQEAIGKSDVSSFQVDASDFSSLLDQKVVVDTYADQYAREIIGRLVYGFTADDSRLDLNDCESLTGVTYSGTAIAPTLDSDAVYKISSVNLGATGAGTATYRFPIIGSPKDLSAYDRIRAWIKLPSFPSDSVSSIKCRIIDGTGKAFEWSDAIIDGPGWSYDSFDFLRASWIGGTPSKTTATYFEIELVAKKAISLGDFKIDRIFSTSGGFTIRGVSVGNILFKDVRAQYKKPSVVIENLAKNNGFAWYVSTSKDLSFFASEKRTAPFSVTDSSTNFGKLKVTADITNLKNRQTVRGGQAPDSVIYDQIHVCDGQETSYRLDYPPKDLSVSVDTGSGFVPATVGVENLVPDSSVDFVFNFSEKTVRNGASPLLAAGTKIKLSYYPYKDIRVQVRDDVSIATMKALLGGDGIFDGAVISDASIKTFEEGRSRAKAEIKAYSNPILTASFETEADGLQAGQVIRITYANFSVDADFVIQKVDARQKGLDGLLTYSVTCGSTMYGLTEFFQYLLKKTETGNIDASELVDVVQTTDDVIVFSDAITGFKRDSANFRTMPSVTQEGLDVGLLGYYRMDGGLAKDYSGNGYDFTTYSGVTSAVGRSGKPDSAFKFTSGSYMTTDSMGLTANSPVSLSLWLKQDVDGTNSAASLIFSTFGGVYSYIRETTNLYRVRYDAGGAREAAYTMGAGFRDWIHFVYTFNGTNREAVYVNGEVATFATHGTSNASLLFSGLKLGGTFSGLIDGDIRAYNRELTAREAKFLSENDGFLPNGYLPKNTEYVIDSPRYFYHPATSSFSGPTHTANKQGKIPGAFLFDGNDRIALTDFATGVGQEATGFALVYATNVTGTTRRVFMPSNDRSYTLHINTSGQVVATVYDTTYRYVTVTPSVSLLNRWAVIGFTFKNGTLKLFIDGQMVGSLSGIGTLVLGSTYYVGNWSSNAQGWIGKIDEFGLLPRAWSDSEMLELSNYLLNGTDPSLMIDSYADFAVCS